MRGAALLVIVVAFAGCAEQPAVAGVDETIAHGFSGVRGRVMSDELFPVVGANISVGGGPSTQTDAAGLFELFPVAPGDATLFVNATGYESHERAVEIPSEGFAEIVVGLTGIPGEAPYVSTYIFGGFIGCAAAALYLNGWPSDVPCMVGETQQIYSVSVGPDWRGGVHEAIWETLDEMSFSDSIDQPGCNAGVNSHSKCPAYLRGKSPLRAVARPLDFEYAKRFAIHPTEVWPESNYTSYLRLDFSGLMRQEINQTLGPACQVVNGAFGVPPEWGCVLGVGASTGIRFNYYHTTFYLQMPVDLEGFSAVPDE